MQQIKAPSQKGAKKVKDRRKGFNLKRREGSRDQRIMKAPSQAMSEHNQYAIGQHPNPIPTRLKGLKESMKKLGQWGTM